MAHGEQIKTARAWADLTQKQLADELGVDEQWVKRRESNKQNTKNMELLAIAAITRAPIKFLRNGFSDVSETDPALAGPLSDRVDAIRADLELLAEEVHRLADAYGQTNQDQGQ